MRTEQIIYLNEINRKSSLHQAGESLHISTQALSLSIKSLEEELGFQILERSRTGVRLTDKGRRLLDISLSFLTQLQELQSNPEKKYSSSLIGNFHILATTGVVETLFPDLISQLYLDYPRFRIKVRDHEFSSIADILLESNDEFALVYRLSINDDLITQYDDTKLSFSSLFSGRYYCAVPKNHTIAHYKSISLNTMAEYPIVLFSPTKDVLLKLFGHANKKANIIFADNYSVYKQLLATGSGLSLTLVLSQSKVPMVSLPNLKLIPFKEQISSDLGYLYRSNHIFSTIAQDFLSYLQDYVEQYGIRDYPPNN